MAAIWGAGPHLLHEGDICLAHQPMQHHEGLEGSLHCMQKVRRQVGTLNGVCVRGSLTRIATLLEGSYCRHLPIFLGIRLAKALVLSEPA